MDESKLIGVLSLYKYPNFYLFEEFSVRIDTFELEMFKEMLAVKIKKQYLKYLAYLTFFIVISGLSFYLGYAFYETIFGLSLTFSIIFVGSFIYLSRAYQIKVEFFRFFRILLLKEFGKYCIKNEELRIKVKKKKILIFLDKII